VSLPAASISISWSEANRFRSRYGDGIVGLAARAFGFARMRADAAADGGKRVALADEFDRLEIFLFLDELDVALNVHAGRALEFAGRMPF